ncbi:MAG TPA: nucleotidyl transferase AbiEii/AbiGii toxin family protein, partial [Thermobifida alba]|nr:nucleotidyl transferase AbiEii/AbiGii toxin family protein [Thermobifida alba]
MSGTLRPALNILPPPQQRLWPELAAVPPTFTLYGGTAIALRLGHRDSVDFDFFAAHDIDPRRLLTDLPFLSGAVVLE